MLTERKESAVRTTINLDEQLLSEARRITGMKERTALIHEGASPDRA